jgi:hypothetical protein
MMAMISIRCWILKNQQRPHHLDSLSNSAIPLAERPTFAYESEGLAEAHGVLAYHLPNLLPTTIAESL